MAYQSLKAWGDYSHHLFAIIVGNFHAEYLLGLPARLEARKSAGVKVQTVVQVSLEEIPSQEDLAAMVEPHETYGLLGDYIIFTR